MVSFDRSTFSKHNLNSSFQRSELYFHIVNSDELLDRYLVMIPQYLLLEEISVS